MNKPTGACKCALTTGEGYEDLPWADRWINVIADPFWTTWQGASGFTNPVLGAIYLDPKMSEDQMMGVLAHEGGHLRSPFVGHTPWSSKEDTARRFNTPDTQCNGNWLGSHEQYLKDKACACP